MTLRALDLFCGAGGASEGLHRAGFDVVGVDIEPQPEYPFAFIQADALTFPLEGFDLIWASPKCQPFTAYKRRPAHVRPVDNQIPAVRARLRAHGTPYIIENVPGAPLESPVTLCGSMFGLDVRRHRGFETSFPVLAPSCDHSRWTPRFPCATNRSNLRRTVEVGVYRIPLQVQRHAMGISWMSLARLSQAIPPAYAEFLARAFLRSRQEAAAKADRLVEAYRTRFKPIELKECVDVVLVDNGGDRIRVIKVIREIMGLGLVEAKNGTEALPFVVKQSVLRVEAEEMQRRFAEAGGRVELR